MWNMIKKEVEKHDNVQLDGVGSFSESYKYMCHQSTDKPELTSYDLSYSFKQ